MKKPSLLILGLIALNLGGLTAFGAAADELWVPVRSSKTPPSSAYPLLPTYQYTENGWQFIFPDYPAAKNTNNPKIGYGAGIAYNKKVNIEEFSMDIRIDELSNPGSDQWIGFAFSDSVAFPYWGANGNAAQVMFQPMANGQLWVRVYTNINGVQERVFEQQYKNTKLWDKGSLISVVVLKKKKDYALIINGNVLDYYFSPMRKILPDGKFHPVFSAFSNAPAGAKIKYTVLKINGTKPQQ